MCHIEDLANIPNSFLHQIFHNLERMSQKRNFETKFQQEHGRIIFLARIEDKASHVWLLITLM